MLTFACRSRASWEYVSELRLRGSDQVGFCCRVFQRARHLHSHHKETWGHVLLPGSRHWLHTGQCVVQDNQIFFLHANTTLQEQTFELYEDFSELDDENVFAFLQDLDVDPKEMNRETPEETGIYLLSSSLPQHCLYTRLSSLQKLRVKRNGSLIIPQNILIRTNLLKYFKTYSFVH